MAGRRIDPEVRRAQRELDQAHCRECFKDTGNVFFVLWILAQYREDEELPSWVRQWWLQFAKTVLPTFLYRSATKSGRSEYVLTIVEIRKTVLKALGLSRQGKSVLAKLQQIASDDALAMVQRRTGITSATQLAEAMQVKPPRSIDE